MKNTIYILLVSLAACSSEGVVPIKYDAELDPTARRGFVTTDVTPPDATAPDTFPTTDLLQPQEVAMDTKPPSNVAAEPAQDALPPPDTTPPTDTLVLIDTQIEPKDALLVDIVPLQTPDTKIDTIVKLNIQPALTSPLFLVEKGDFCWSYGKFEPIKEKDPASCLQFGYCAFVQPEVTGCSRACIGDKGRILPIPERIERTCSTDGAVGKTGGCEIDEICGKKAENSLICKRIHCKTLGVTNIECPQGVWCLPSLSELGGTCSTSVDEAKLVRLGAGVCT
jgi:hypothetical protein